MIQPTRPYVPTNHPLRRVFQQLAERGMGQLHNRDADTIQYLADLLTEFVHAENLYRIRGDAGEPLRYLCDMLAEASLEMSPSVRRDYYKHVGDLALFNLGLFPEQLTYGRRTISAEYYAQQGRRSYNMIAEMDASRSTVVFRKLSENFQECVAGLNWVKVYISDPFFQYMFRQFDVI